jgi:hypothetical protein
LKGENGPENGGKIFLTDAVETVLTAVLPHERGLGWSSMMTGSPKAQPDGPTTTTFGGVGQTAYGLWNCEYISNLELLNRLNQETT